MTFITIPDKTNGSTLSAAEFNQILDAIKDGTLDINTGDVYLDGNLLTFSTGLTNTDSTITLDQSAISIPASQVSDFDTEVANNSAVSANTAKVSFTWDYDYGDLINKPTIVSSVAGGTGLTSTGGTTPSLSHDSHTGEVTGSTTLTIANNVVDEANMKISNAPTNDWVLTADSAATGGWKWAAAAGGITWSTAVDADIIPATTGTYDLGSTSRLFTYVHSQYVAGFSTTDRINFTTSGEIQFLTNSAERLAVKDTGVQFGNTGATVTVINTTFVDNDTSLMTSQAIKEKITSYGYGTGDMSDVVDDTTPSLGGDLDWNSNGTFLSGQTVGGSNGDVVYLSSANTWSQADASAESTCSKQLAIRIDASNVLTHGVYTTSGLTAGAIYYVSETTGAITATAPTTSTSIVRGIGYALSTTELFVDPDTFYIEVA